MIAMTTEEVKTNFLAGSMEPCQGVRNAEFKTVTGG